MRVAKILIILASLSLMMFSCEEEEIDPLLGTWAFSVEEDVDEDGINELEAEVILTLSGSDFTWESSFEANIDYGDSTLTPIADSCSESGTWSVSGDQITLVVPSDDESEEDEDGDDDGGPPDCALDCEGIDEDGDSDDANVFCAWFLNAYNGDEDGNSCLDDCDGDLEVAEAYMACSECMDDSDLDCNDVIDVGDDDDYDDDGYNLVDMLVYVCVECLASDSLNCSDIWGDDDYSDYDYGDYDDYYDDGGPPECVMDCEGWEEDGDSDDGDIFCTWLVGAEASGCLDDCDDYGDYDYDDDYDYGDYDYDYGDYDYGDYDYGSYGAICPPEGESTFTYSITGDTLTIFDDEGDAILSFTKQ